MLRGGYKHIVIDVAVWLAVLGVAAAVLYTSRLYGTRYLARQRADELLQRVVMSLDQGAMRQAQQDALRAYGNAPVWVADHALERFGARLLLMPEFYDKLRSHYTRDTALQNNFERIQRLRLGLLEGGEEDWSALQSAMGQLAPDDSSVLLERARLALGHGDFPQARALFNEYWQRSGRNRSEAVATIAGPAVEVSEAAGAQKRIDTAYRLFRAGLWVPAVQTAQPAGKILPADPGVLFFDAIGLELKNRPGEAKARYEAVLAAAPTHRLALRRLQFLATR